MWVRGLRALLERDSFYACSTNGATDPEVERRAEAYAAALADSGPRGEFLQYVVECDIDNLLNQPRMLTPFLLYLVQYEWRATAIGLTRKAVALLDSAEPEIVGFAAYFVRHSVADGEAVLERWLQTTDQRAGTVARVRWVLANEKA
jgi:hypothetical protein